MIACWAISQVYAPVHTAHVTQNWIAASCAEFIGRDEWSGTPNYPDLSPMEYIMSGELDWTASVS